MEKWKNLMITMLHWECDEAQKLLKSHGIETIYKVILMAEADEPLHVYGCAKLTINEENYEKALLILNMNGLKSQKQFIDGSCTEVIMPDSKQN